LWKTFQSPRKRLSRHIPSHITRVSNRPNGNCTTYFHLLRVICQLAPNVSRSSHIPPLLLDTLGSAKPLALTGFFFRSWRHRHTYRGDLLDFLHALPPDIRLILSSRGHPRLFFGRWCGQKFGGNRRECVACALGQVSRPHEDSEYLC
jgi:hypothetical protein